MDDKRYFQCTACGQVVQGWNVSQEIQCCLDKRMIEIRPQAPDPFMRRPAPNGKP